jgi:hypothetical protein
MQWRGRYHALAKERIILLRCESLEPPILGSLLAIGMLAMALAGVNLAAELSSVTALK